MGTKRIEIFLQVKSKTCSCCESYFPGCICAGSTEYYGKEVAEDFTCPCWDISMSEYVELLEAWERTYGYLSLTEMQMAKVSY
jgi:hypothetical protein